ncbi:MAG TPA: transposase family protein [Candidatus Nitrosocosmicus sp.]
MISYERLSKKPLLFKSFTGLTVQQFDDIFYKEITKKYEKYELKRLSHKRKGKRKRKAGAGRHFKMDLKDRFVMILVYYRLYITYTLADFLFDLAQSNICRDIQKIEQLVRKYTNSTKDIQQYKKAKNARRSREILSRFSYLYRLYRTTDTATYG